MHTKVARKVSKVFSLSDIMLDHTYTFTLISVRRRIDDSISFNTNKSESVQSGRDRQILNSKAGRICLFSYRSRINMRIIELQFFGFSKGMFHLNTWLKYFYNALFWIILLEIPNNCNIIIPLWIILLLILLLILLR